MVFFKTKLFFTDVVCVKGNLFSNYPFRYVFYKNYSSFSRFAQLAAAFIKIFKFGDFKILYGYLK